MNDSKKFHFPDEGITSVNDIWPTETAQLTNIMVAEASRAIVLENVEVNHELKKNNTMDDTYEIFESNSIETNLVAPNSFAKRDNRAGKSTHTSTELPSRSFGFHDIHTNEFVPWSTLFYPEYRCPSKNRKGILN
jgi:hypothetical protein